MKIVCTQNYGEFSEESFEKKFGVIRGHTTIWYECECLATRASPEGERVNLPTSLLIDYISYSETLS